VARSGVGTVAGTKHRALQSEIVGDLPRPQLIVVQSRGNAKAPWRVVGWLIVTDRASTGQLFLWLQDPFGRVSEPETFCEGSGK
jgi:hypothetical protein